MKLLVFPILLLPLISCVSRETRDGSAAYFSPSGHVAIPDSAPAPVSAPASNPTPIIAPAESAAGPVLADYSCDISISGVPDSLRAGGAPVKIQAKVTNRSTKGETWTASLPGRSSKKAINIASYWVSGKVQKEGPHARLTADLQPGQSADVDLMISPPKTPGNYELRVTPLQEEVAWFDTKGGCSRRFDVKVTP